MKTETKPSLTKTERTSVEHVNALLDELAELRQEEGRLRAIADGLRQWVDAISSAYPGGTNASLGSDAVIRQLLEILG